jgi:integrase
MKWDNFTAGRIDAFKCAEGKKQSIYWDGKTPGLGLRVTTAGAKSFIFETALANKTLRITIGDTKTWSIADAQAKATAYKSQTDNGIDPRQVKADKLAANVAKATSEAASKAANEQSQALDDAKRYLLARTAWDAYVAAPHPKWGEQHRRDHKIAASPGGLTSKLAGRITKAAPLASLLELPLSSITASVVQDWLIAECQTRPTFAHNSFRKFRTFVRWCAKQPQFQLVTHGDCCLTDEVKDIVPASKTKEGDSLQREQLSAWFDAVRKIGNPVISAYLQALLITGARREELARLRWVDVDFQWRSLTIHDKVEGLRTIPLTQYAATLLAALPRRNHWVFSSPTAADGRLTEPRIAHTKALVIAGLPHVSLHGLRRSFGTLCEWVEVPSGVSAQIMGHKPSALAEKHYRRRPIDLLRKWHDMIEAWMLEQADIAFVPTVPAIRAVIAA